MGNEEVQTKHGDQDLEAIAATVRAAAQQRQGQSLELLALLRLIESLHREIRDGLFQSSLPNSRQALHALLRDIEAQGGWPYIYRMRLIDFLATLADGVAEDGVSLDSDAVPPASEE